MSKRLNSVHSDSVTKKAKTMNSKSSSINEMNRIKYKVFVDLDGVLVDFEAGIRRLFPNIKSSSDIPTKQLWPRVASVPNFFTNLQWTNDGQLLWNTLLDNCTLNNKEGTYDVPDVLTGIPTNKTARAQKFTWCRRNLAKSSIQISHADFAAPKSEHRCIAGQRLSNPNRVNVITCWSRNKHFESKAHCILIDDRGDHVPSNEVYSLREKWEARGGIFIQHTDAKSTIQKLVDIGVIIESDGNSQDEKSKSVVGFTEKRESQQVIDLLDDVSD